VVLPAVPGDVAPLAARVLDDLRSSAGPRALPMVEKHLAAAAHFLDADDVENALIYAREVKKVAPRSRFGREILGLALYRAGRYPEAVAELRAFRRMSGDSGRDVILADAERAAGKVAEATKRLEAVRANKEASDDDRVEALIVLASIAADTGDLVAARQLLESGPVAPRALEDHHLRLWYALGDLTERAGDREAALSWFSKVDTADPDWSDAADRIAALRRGDRDR
jgi:tetratricopeptide (TPR) repeat protein